MSPDSTLPQSPRRRILVAEDEDNLRSLLKLSLGRVYEVQTVEDGQAAVEAFEDQPADMVILDIMMPRMDCLTACEQIRRRSDAPIIMLTALGSVDDVVKGFNLGADDYITKPFTFKELMARIEAVFRRLDWSRQPLPTHVIVNGEVKLDADTHQVWLNNQEIHLTPIEFQLLHYLIGRPGQSVSKETLFREVWGYDLAGGTNLVEVGVRRLREKVEQDPSNPQLILTARGMGYKFRTPPAPNSR
ncbi:MAG: response regulator transcription factor [Chloroflexi bacterium]|nr:response regulator transcription factor [Chloroflexota bacterium]